MNDVLNISFQSAVYISNGTFEQFILSIVKINYSKFHQYSNYVIMPITSLYSILIAVFLEIDHTEIILFNQQIRRRRRYRMLSFYIIVLRVRDLKSIRYFQGAINSRNKIAEPYLVDNYFSLNCLVGNYYLVRESVFWDTRTKFLRDHMRHSSNFPRTFIKC